MAEWNRLMGKIAKKRQKKAKISTTHYEMQNQNKRCEVQQILVNKSGLMTLKTAPCIFNDSKTDQKRKMAKKKSEHLKCPE